MGSRGFHHTVSRTTAQPANSATAAANAVMRHAGRTSATTAAASAARARTSGITVGWASGGATDRSASQRPDRHDRGQAGHHRGDEAPSRGVVAGHEPHSDRDRGRHDDAPREHVVHEAERPVHGHLGTVDRERQRPFLNQPVRSEGGRVAPHPVRAVVVPRHGPVRSDGRPVGRRGRVHTRGAGVGAGHRLVQEVRGGSTILLNGAVRADPQVGLALVPRDVHARATLRGDLDERIVGDDVDRDAGGVRVDRRDGRPVVGRSAGVGPGDRSGDHDRGAGQEERDGDSAPGGTDPAGCHRSRTLGQDGRSGPARRSARPRALRPRAARPRAVRPRAVRPGAGRPRDVGRAPGLPPGPAGHVQAGRAAPRAARSGSSSPDTSHRWPCGRVSVERCRPMRTPAPFAARSRTSAPRS